MEKTARCACSALCVTVAGDPMVVIACHCTQCQRRTGSVFGVGAYYPREQVAIDGASKAYVRDGQQGRKLTNHFCPQCGTTLYWQAETLPDALGIAVGAFGDADFPMPARSVWEQSKHRWVDLGPELQHFPQGSIRNPPGPSR